MSLIRVLRTEQRTLTRRIYSDGQLVDATGDVTVQVARLDGTVLTSGTGADEAGTGIYSFVLPGGPAAPASVTWQLDTLVVTWSGTIAGAAVTLPPDYVEVAGGHLFGLAEAVEEHHIDTAKHPMAKLALKRIEVEMVAEDIARRAFVPRFARLVTTGSGTSRLPLPYSEPRVVRSVTVDGTAWTSDELQALVLVADGTLRRPDGAVWPQDADVVVEWEHGWSVPPPDVATAAKRHLLAVLGAPKSAIPDRAVSFNAVAGGVYRLATAGEESTGIAEVDAAYKRWGRKRRPVIA